MNLRVSIMGMGAIKAKLTKLASDLKNPQIPMMQSAIQVQEETFRNFEKGGRPEEWAPLSLLTLFIRANRADGPKRTGSNIPLSDSGRLKSSFMPFVDNSASAFGVSTNVEYAGMMQRGGISEAQDIEIKGVNRRLRESQFEDFATGRIRKVNGMQPKGKTRDYVMHLKGGAEIPARPFFPSDMDELNSWGYQVKIKRIFSEFFKQAL